jgi:hypothetical protein
MSQDSTSADRGLLCAERTHKYSILLVFRSNVAHTSARDRGSLMSGRRASPPTQGGGMGAGVEVGIAGAHAMRA